MTPTTNRDELADEEADEQVSVCCGAPEDPDIPGFCSACRDGTSFEPATEEATR